MEKIERKVKNLVRGYDSKKSLYKDFAFSVKRIIEEIIKKEDIGKYIQIVTAREKDPESLTKKLLNKMFDDNPQNIAYLEKKEIENFADIKDLAGVRIILYFNGDVLKKLRMALQEEFSYSAKDERRHNDSAGQESIHSIIEFSDERLRLSEYAKFKGLRCEIQIVTALQHAWSELEHDVVYKPDNGKWEGLEVEKFSKMFKDAKDHIKKASDIFESIMYIHLSGDKFILFDKFDDLDNNKLYEYLDRLKVYMEKNYIQNDIVLNDILNKIKKIVAVAKENKIVNEPNIFGELEGKTFEDILLKTLGILNDQRVKYFSQENFEGVFKLAVEWSEFLQKDDSKVKMNDFFKKLSKYDYNVLKQAGLFNQKIILGVISKWNNEEKIKHCEIIKAVVKEFLQPSFEWSNMVEWNKLQFSSGSLIGDRGGKLAKIRRESIDFIFESYELVGDEGKKFELIKVLDEASRTSHSGIEESLEKIIIDDINYLIGKYQKFVFNKKGKVICSLPVAMDIEKQLLWFKKRWQEKIGRRVDSFISKLKKDKTYSVYRNLVDRDRLDYLENEKRGVTMRVDVKKVIANNEWIAILNDIAKAYKIDESWKFNDFHGFLTEISEASIKNGKYFLADAFKNNSSLLEFADALMVGFRNSGKMDLWDKYVKEIESKNDGDLLAKALQSFHFHLRNSKNVKFRSDDFSWIKNIGGKKGKYEFLLKNTYNKFYFDYIYFRVLLLTWKYKNKKSENLIIDELKKISDNSLDRKLEELELFISWGDVDISGWEKKNIEYLTDCLIKNTKLDYHAQGLLGKIGKINFEYVVDVIKGRLDLSDRPRKITEYYDAIPMHLEEKFILLIKENQDKFENKLASWIIGKKAESFNSYECGSLLQQLDSVHSSIIRKLIKKDTSDAFDKALGMTRSINGSDLNLIFEIANVIVNSKKLKIKEKNDFLKHIGGSMFSTGMTSGEYGISEAHKTKANEIIKIKEELEKNKKSKMLIEFADKMIKALQDQSVKERIDEDKQIKIMEINFEG